MTYVRRTGGKVAEGGDRQGCFSCNDLVLPENILEAAKVLIIKKNTITEEQEMKKRMEDMEKTLRLLANQQNHVIALINDMRK